MIQQRYKSNESGAALMIVLFIVVLVSIVGTAMLSTTTYGLQNVVKTTKEQEEFYRAEGALEIVLSEMSNYKNSSTGSSGPFAYLKEQPSSATYQIGEKNVQVNISTSPDISTIIPKSSKQTVEVMIEANYDNQSNISRIMTFDVEVSAETKASTETAYNYVDDSAFKDKGQYKIQIDQIQLNIYNKIINELGINWSSFTTEVGKNEVEKGETFVFPSGISKYKEISLSGNGRKMIIPSDSIVFAKTIDLRGSGNTDSQLVIEGALVAETLDNNGNSVVTVNSGLIVNHIKGTSKAFEVNGKASGISCSLLPVACQVLNDSSSSTKNTSNIQSKTIEFSTDR